MVTVYLYTRSVVQQRVAFILLGVVFSVVVVVIVRIVVVAAVAAVVAVAVVGLPRGSLYASSY